MTVLRIVCVSDTHCQLDKIKMPDGDILLHSGDFTMNGNLHEVSKEIGIFGKFPHTYKICCVGNHDFFFERYPKEAKQLCVDNGVIYLESESIIIEGIKFYGSSYSKWFYDWAFNLKKDGSNTKEHWAKIPLDTNVLITHGPAYGILDRVLRGENVGCPEIRQKIEFDLPELLLFQFGHIHLNGGKTEVVNNVWCANASICDERYATTNKPILFDLNTETKSIIQVFEDD